MYGTFCSRGGPERRRAGSSPKFNDACVVAITGSRSDLGDALSGRATRLPESTSRTMAGWLTWAITRISSSKRASSERASEYSRRRLRSSLIATGCPVPS